MKKHLISLLLTITALAEPTEGYHLFSPRPRAEMRDFNTDRPDQTESPYTVDAGHFQWEMDLLNFTRDTEDGRRVDTLNVAPFNLKIGLLDNTDLHLIYETWIWQRETAPQKRWTQRGSGDLTIRLKHNFWGNDGGTTALAIMPYVTVPTKASDLGRDDAEGGVIIPFGWNLSDKLFLGVMTQWKWLPGEMGGTTHAWTNTASLGVSLTDRLGSYFELATTVFDDASPWQATLDGGFTYMLTENVQLDLGCNFGITESAPDLQPFVGVTYRY
jgi:Putative MetA-pathway of phenol degradation